MDLSTASAGVIPFSASSRAVLSDRLLQFPVLCPGDERVLQVGAYLEPRGGWAARRAPEIPAADSAHSTASKTEQPSTARKLPT